jgi:hypothetical protein
MSTDRKTQEPSRGAVELDDAQLATAVGGALIGASPPPDPVLPLASEPPDPIRPVVSEPPEPGRTRTR